MKYRWILFDADDTLFDYERAEHHALSSALRDNRIDCTAEHLQIYQRINQSCWRAFERGEMDREVLRVERFRLLFSELGRPVDPASFARIYTGHLSEAGFLIEGAREMLQRLRSRFRLGLITNGLSDIQRPRLQRSALESYFELVVISDEIGHNKPQRGFFEYTHRAMDHPAHREVLVVGDNLNADIRGAAEFGMDTCWYNPRRLPNELAVRPTVEVRDLPALEDWLLQ